MNLATGLVPGLQMIVTACNRRLDWRVHFSRTFHSNTIRCILNIVMSPSHYPIKETGENGFKRFGLEVRNRGCAKDYFNN
jgi:hypothetical protein